MNFKHTAIKSLCKRIFIDMQGVAMKLTYEDGSENVINEGHIDIIRLTRDVNDFSVTFNTIRGNVSVTLSFDQRSALRPFDTVQCGTMVQVLSAKASDPDIISNQQMGEIVSEILAIAESDIRNANKGVH